MWLKEYVKKHDRAPKLIADSIMDWLENGRADAVFVMKDNYGYSIIANVIANVEVVEYHHVFDFDRETKAT